MGEVVGTSGAEDVGGMVDTAGVDDVVVGWVGEEFPPQATVPIARAAAAMAVSKAGIREWWTRIA